MPRLLMRFYAELNDFLPKALRGRAFEHESAPRAPLRDIIEGLGVPHTEIDLVLVNGQSVSLEEVPPETARVSVYPVFEALDIAGSTRIRPEPLRQPRFVLDVHLGRLCAYLRMAGFDTAYSARADDEDLAAVSAREERILLTRDQGLLKRRVVTHGHWVRNTAPRLQFHEILNRFDLRRLLAPFTRCLRCNTLLVAVAGARVADRVPPRVLASHHDYHECPTCRRVFWRGTHYQRMIELLAPPAVAVGTQAGQCDSGVTSHAAADYAVPDDGGLQDPAQQRRSLPAPLSSVEWAAWTARDVATLVFVVRDGQVLLIRKKRGLGAGKVNGPGGRLDPGESPAACAAREVAEELLVEPVGLATAGELRFQFVDGYSIHVHVFRADDVVGTPTETVEATPLWTPVGAIPYDEMWADDRIWLPHLLAGRWFDGWFVFDGDRMLGHRVTTGRTDSSATGD